MIEGCYSSSLNMVRKWMAVAKPAGPAPTIRKSVSRDSRSSKVDADLFSILESGLNELELENYFIF